MLLGARHGATADSIGMSHGGVPSSSTRHLELECSIRVQPDGVARLVDGLYAAAVRAEMTHEPQATDSAARDRRHVFSAGPSFVELALELQRLIVSSGGGWESLQS